MTSPAPSANKVSAALRRTGIDFRSCRNGKNGSLVINVASESTAADVSDLLCEMGWAAEAIRTTGADDLWLVHVPTEWKGGPLS